MSIEDKPTPLPNTTPSTEHSKEGQAITWEWLHAHIAKALGHIEPGAPLYITADVLTDELLTPLKSVNHPL